MAEKERNIQPVINVNVNLIQEGDQIKVKGDTIGQKNKVQAAEIGQIVIPETSQNPGVPENSAAQSPLFAEKSMEGDFSSTLQRLDLSNLYQDNYFAEEQASLLVHESKYRDALIILEKLSSTQRQQMMLFECYCQLGKNEQALQCIETLRKLVASSSIQSKAEDAYKLGITMMTKGRYTHALSIFSCASKLYSLNPNAFGALEGLRSCGHQTVSALEKMMEQEERKRIIVWDVGLDLVRNIHSVVKILSVVDKDRKVNTEAHCLNQLGHVFYLFEKYEMSLELYKNAYEIMSSHFGSKATERRVYGHLLNNIGNVYSHLKKYSESISWFENAFIAYETIIDWPDEKQKKDAVLRTENNLSFVRQQLEK